MNRGTISITIASITMALTTLFTLCWISPRDAAAQSGGQTVIKKLDKKLRVEIGGHLFTEYLYEGHNKPILYPVIGPRGIPMTRNYPMKIVSGEAGDHPHHRSLWFTHGSVNGISFWHEGKGAGTTVHDKIISIVNGDKDGGDRKASLETANRWIGPDGKVVCRDTRKITFFETALGRVIDYEVTLHASEGDLVLGDTKEGTMGIRTNPVLRLSNDEKRGVTGAKGQAINSEGVQGSKIWGKKAAWVDYWAPIQGEVVGVAIFNHPKNPVHPTWWHARSYGLVAANPFGVHDFERKPKGTGDMKIASGEKLTFKYRFYFHTGDNKAGKVAEAYADYSKH